MNFNLHSSNMHEWALAEAVVSSVVEVSKRERLKEITKLKIKIGELQQIELETFEFVLKDVLQPQGELIKKAKIELETEIGILKCKVCGHRWTFSDMTINEEESESIHFIPEIAKVYIRCPKCKSPDFEIVEGRGVWIESIEGIK